MKLTLGDWLWIIICVLIRIIICVLIIVLIAWTVLGMLGDCAFVYCDANATVRP